MKSKILNFLLKIPKSKVVSYKVIGDKFSIHPRAVAKILSENSEQDKFPCYKIINSDGRIGGYNLGTEEKIRRLNKDGIIILNGKIDKKFFWQD